MTTKELEDIGFKDFSTEHTHIFKYEIEGTICGAMLVLAKWVNNIYFNVFELHQMDGEDTTIIALPSYISNIEDMQVFINLLKGGKVLLTKPILM